MNARWLVTPYFFDEYDPGLSGVVPDGANLRMNDPGEVHDRSPESLSRTHVPIASFVEQAVGAGELPVSVAGDCAASLPVMAGLQATGLSPVLIWLDGHGDFNIPETSPSGFLGGMPLAMMVGRGNQAFGKNVGLTPVPEQDVWLVGARDLDPPERENLRNSRVNRIDVSDLGQLRVDRPVYLHIDNDVIDASEVPANNYPVIGGPGLVETMAACTRFASQNDARAVSLSGWNSALDSDGRTCLACKRLMKAVTEACRR